MTSRADPARGVVAALAVFILIALVAIPAMAAAPSGKPAGQAAAAPVAAATATPKPTKAPKPSKAPKAPAVDVTATGTVGTRTDANGRTEYTLTSGSTVRVLSAGPPWYWGDDNPLKPYVGKQVTVAGTSRAGDDEIDVVSVDGTAIREPGKPPWAGGWKAVGKAHPGWSQEKADRWEAKLKARGVDCWPPGHCKDASADTDED